MSLQEYDQKLQDAEKEFKERLDNQKRKFELEFQNQREEFNQKHQELANLFNEKYNSDRETLYLQYENMEKDFNQKIQDLGKTTINSLLNQEPKKLKPPAKLSFDKTIDPELYAAFDKKPYLIMPSEKKNSLYVYVPKFKGNFQVGWLKDEVDQYYRYEVNQYSILFGSVPDEILQEFNMPTPIKAKVVNDKIHFDPKDKKFIKSELTKFVTDWTDSSARITKGHEFDILDQILKSGYIPFEEKPVLKEHLLPETGNIKLRPYQKPVWNNFLKCGAVGVFHATGSGKSFIGMEGLDRVRDGNKRNLVLSTKRAHLDQWGMYVEEKIPHALENTLFSTYQGFKNFDEEFGLTIYDECRSLPAKSFSRLATINTTYRMGMDATPYREDGLNHLIAALTGFAQNMDWPQYMRDYGPGYHPIFVHMVHNQLGKIHKAKSLFNPKKRTMLYSYHLDVGQQVADKLNLPFINASTENRLEVAKSNHSFVATSVFTDGVSFDDLEQIIEVDFQFGSRQEEMQLSGRLMHSKAKNKAHHIIMTESDYDSYGKRLLSLEGNGFHVKVLENGS